MFSRLVTFFRDSQVFPFLVVFRWASLSPAALTLNYHEGQGIFPPLTMLMLAVLANAVISVFDRQLDQLVMDHPLARRVDLFFCAWVLAISGGSHSPYYLYALSPLLAGAFFFQVPGAIAGSIAFTPLYLLANSLGTEISSATDNITRMTQLTSIWLIPVLFTYTP